MKYEVITFGSGTIDIHTETASERTMQICTDDSCEEVVFYPSGEKVLLSDVHTEIGGGGTNTAACLSKLGIPVAYGGAVGKDGNGDAVVSWCDGAGVDFLGTRVDAKTNLSLVLDSKRLHDRTILIYKGSSSLLRAEDLDLSKMHSTWYYFSSLVGESYRTMLALMRHARQSGIAVAFNPSSYQTQQGLAALREPISLSQLLIMNKEEAEMLVGKGSPEELCVRLRMQGAEIVMVTNGRAGSTLLYADTIYFAAPSPEARIVETTGAGDCFASSFLAGLILGKDPQESLRLACVNTESLISEVGAKNGLLDRDKALERLSADKREIPAKPLLQNI